MTKRKFLRSKIFDMQDLLLSDKRLDESLHNRHTNSNLFRGDDLYSMLRKRTHRWRKSESGGDRGFKTKNGGQQIYQFDLESRSNFKTHYNNYVTQTEKEYEAGGIPATGILHIFIYITNGLDFGKARQATSLIPIMAYIVDHAKSVNSEVTHVSSGHKHLIKSQLLIVFLSIKYKYIHTTTQFHKETQHKFSKSLWCS
ncbi:hypothetical protein YC2023_033082 [Brassica napus]